VPERTAGVLTPPARRGERLGPLMGKLVLACLIQFALLTQAHAWGPEGHSIVAEIAQRRLSPEAAAKVQEILGENASLASIASWADDYRALHLDSAGWHFVDIPLAAQDYEEGRDCALTSRRSTGRSRRIEPRAASRSQALRWTRISALIIWRRSARLSTVSWPSLGFVSRERSSRRTRAHSDGFRPLAHRPRFCVFGGSGRSRARRSRGQASPRSTVRASRRPSRRGSATPGNSLRRTD
jgi:S1/P1 Nuclease